MRAFGKAERAVIRWCVITCLVAGSGLRGAEEAWIKVVTEHFTILTPAGEPAARKWAMELEQFRRGLQAVVPVSVERLRPVTVVLFNNYHAMKPYLPLEHDVPARMGGIFVRANDINAIMLSIAGDTHETRHMIFHEAVHWQLSALDLAMPLWLGEGLAELYATFELPDAKSYAFGLPIDRYIEIVRRGPLLPLHQLMEIDRGSLLYNEGTRASIFYAQSWAFVHFLFYGEGSPGRGAVMRYLELLKTARSREEAFKEAFGGTYAELDQRLLRYIRGGRYRKQIQDLPRIVSHFERSLITQPASRADLELARGSLLFGTRAPADAEPHLRLAAQLAPADPRAWELLGHIGIARHDFETAGAVLAKAVMAGSTSYLVYHHLAMSRLPEPLVRDWAAFDRADLDKAAADYRSAIRLAPSFVDAYEGLAGLTYSMETYQPHDQEVLEHGLAQAPGNTMIEAGLAAAEIRGGHAVEGRARLERICARGAEAPDRGVVFARQILGEETVHDELAEIERLGKESRFAEILAIVERALARPLDRRHRQTMEGVQRRITGFQRITEAVELWNRHQPAAAKQLLEEVVATSSDTAAKDEAAAFLHKIEKLFAHDGPD